MAPSEHLFIQICFWTGYLASGVRNGTPLAKYIGSIRGHLFIQICIHNAPSGHPICNVISSFLLRRRIAPNGAELPVLFKNQFISRYQCDAPNYV